MMYCEALSHRLTQMFQYATNRDHKFYQDASGNEIHPPNTSNKKPLNTIAFRNQNNNEHFVAHLAKVLTERNPEEKLNYVMDDWYYIPAGWGQDKSGLV